MGELFGTDGIRGEANRYPITPEIAVRIGMAAATFFNKGDSTPRIVIGKDGRISGDMLEAALCAGICATGADAVLAGMLPTPGVACLTRLEHAAAGISISASHNPFYDNGIKIFSGDGYKLSEKQESEIEKRVLEGKKSPVSEIVRKTGRIHHLTDASERYEDFLRASVPPGTSFKEISILIDCANGATSAIAPNLFSGFGGNTTCFFYKPNGQNINDNCGSEHPETLKQYVIEKGADIGLAFDGDGDRIIAVDESGCVLTGDQILAVCAGHMKRQNTLQNNRVVSTVMSNIGLGLSLKQMGIQHIKTDVGDRHVVAEMISTGAVLGGEDSGHVVFLDHHSTGDGMLSALHLLGIMKATAKPLSKLSRIMTVFPQILINVEVREKPDIQTVSCIRNAVHLAEKKLGEKGRVLVRYSGTQPLCRIMVEGRDMSEINRFAKDIASVVERELG